MSGESDAQEDTKGPAGSSTEPTSVGSGDAAETPTHVEASPAVDAGPASAPPAATEAEPEREAPTAAAAEAEPAGAAQTDAGALEAEAPAVEAPTAEPPAEEPSPPEPRRPLVVSVTPDHGPLGGGATIVIEGEAFAEGCEVLIGGTRAITVRKSDTLLRVETPPRAQKGMAELRVVNPDARFGVYGDDYRYDPSPILRGVEPAFVTCEGGSVLTLLGADFTHGCAVRIDGELVPSSWANGGRLEVVTPKHAAGAVSVAVVNPDGQQVVREEAVRYAVPPRIDALEPAIVRTAGGAEVTIRGAGFEAGCAVLVGGEAVAEPRFVSDVAVVFVAPAHATPEACDVAVVNPSGLVHRSALGLTYTKSPPQVASVSPERGPSTGGTELVVRGADFDERASVFVCGLAAKATFKSHYELTVVTPGVARDGLVDVRVVNADDQADTLERCFCYVASLPPPKLLQVGPTSGSQLGGLEVAVLGEDFAEGVAVRFGAVQAAVKFLTHKELRATTPAYVGYGEVAVDVQNPDGATSTLEGAFTYEPRPAPEITGIAPTAGPATGGTRVVIEGKNFTREAAVFIGREHPKDLVFRSATELHIVTAARKQVGVVDVEVAVPGAPRGVMKNGFRYDGVPAPQVTSVSPNAGTPAGGTEMTISGKNFLKESVVLVDGKAPRAVKLVDASTLELKTPPGEAGKMVDVLVRNPDGKEAVQKRAFLYDPRYRG